MKQNTQTSNEPTATVMSLTANQVMVRDLTFSILVVSILINLFVLVGWILLQVTTQYDAQLAQFLFVR